MSGRRSSASGCGGQDNCWPVIAPHRVQRYANVACHSLVRPPRARCPAAQRGATIAAPPRKATQETRVRLQPAKFHSAEQTPRDRRNVREDNDLTAAIVKAAAAKLQ